MDRLERILVRLGADGGGEARAAVLTARGWIEWCRGRGSFADALFARPLRSARVPAGGTAGGTGPARDPLRLGGQAGRRLAEVRAGRRLSRCGGQTLPAGPGRVEGADPENRETMVAETRLGPCIKCG